ncbi:outer membrane protein [Ancylobacter amanitiformis]|uniref:Opacity protein-like surface antigen n=1 Tax=Ancylobacter amanitiformis TaxID=217069 RepID=A0ABU0LNT2_9HYPH|nr:OmpW family outer membrane protein [Ancylobacter amanitiformis]MDQ0510365.1 opacity protein-like surface antigen [Ancylobacter amanitiformis]
MRGPAIISRLRGVIALSAGLVAAGLAMNAVIATPAHADEVASESADDVFAHDLLANDLLANAPQIEEGAGWYLRGDLGYVVNETPDGLRFGFFPAAADIGDAWMLGVGIGVRLNDWLRVDVTADYRTQADLRAAGGAGDLSAFTTLANTYVDLGSWHGLTPYVGAGVGAGYLSVSDISFPAGALKGRDGWGLAWALMAGVSVELTPTWVVDAGYRYIAIDSADIGGGWNSLNQNAHEFRLGLRFLFD